MNFIANNNLSTLVAFFTAVVIAVLASLNIKILVLFLCLFLISVIAIRKRVVYFSFLSLFVSISLIPSAFVSSFRISTSFGNLRPAFLIISAFITMALILQLLVKGSISKTKEMNGLLLSLFLFNFINICSIFVNHLGMVNLIFVLFSFIFSFGALLFTAICGNFVKPITLLKLCIFISSIVSIIGIVEFFGLQLYEPIYKIDHANFFYALDSSAGLRRIVSSVGNPLVLAGYLVFCFPFILYLKEQSKKKKWWNVSLILHVLVILFTQSRSAIIALAITLMIFSIRKLGTFFKNTIIITIIIGVFIASLKAFGVWEHFKDRIFFNSEVESYSLRADAYSVALHTMGLMPHPFFGIGLGRFTDFIYSQGLFGMVTLDNVFLGVMVNSGFWGLLFLLLSLFVLWKQIRKMDVSLKLTGYSLLVNFIIMGFSFEFLGYESVGVVFWIFSGLLILQNRVIKSLQQNL